jgi:hypothetical protein
MAVLAGPRLRYRCAETLMAVPRFKQHRALTVSNREASPVQRELAGVDRKIGQHPS